MVINVIKTFIDWLNSTTAFIQIDWDQKSILTLTTNQVPSPDWINTSVQSTLQTLITHVKYWAGDTVALLYFNRVIALIICW